MIRGVIFDLEGTLVRLPIDYKTLYDQIRRELKIAKVNPLTQTLKILDGESRAKIFNLWEHAELKALPNITLNDEGMKIYRAYSNKPTVLVTMQGKTIVEKILNQFHLSFTAVITREYAIDRSHQIRKALKDLRLKPRTVLVVGDRETDAAAATEVGCQFIKVRA